MFGEREAGVVVADRHSPWDIFFIQAVCASSELVVVSRRPQARP